jgi:hypothetical protein
MSQIDPRILAEFLKSQRAERDELGGILLERLIEKIPWGLEVDLGFGRKATLVPMNDGKEHPSPKQQPIYDGDDPAVTGDPVGHQEWSFAFDWKLENCDQDHIEITVKISGGGGAA